LSQTVIKDTYNIRRIYTEYTYNIYSRKYLFSIIWYQYAAKVNAFRSLVCYNSI